METYEFTQFAPSLSTVHVALVRSATNAAQILQDLKTKGAGAFPIQLALIDAALIASKEHLLIAIHQALLSNSRGEVADQQLQDGVVDGATVVRGLKTKSIHSEVLWNLSISSNIMDSFRTFGVSEKTKDVIAVHIAYKDGPSREQVLSQILDIVQGDVQNQGLVALNAWKDDGNIQGNSPADWSKIAKVYKLEGLTDKKQIEQLVTSMVAMKSVAA